MSAPAWLEVYRHPRVKAMLFLGFSAGLPFLLVFSTLSAWLRSAGIALSSIGLLSYVLTAYSVKVLWAPIVDRVPLPFLTRALGRRRAWMLLAQVVIIGGLFAMSGQDVAVDLSSIVWLALLVAFASATQDIAVDAWRIEAAPGGQQGPMASAYQFGYRIGLLAAGAGALTLAGEQSWQVAYGVMALLGSIGVVTTLAIDEPEPAAARDTALREGRVAAWLEKREHWPRPLRRVGAFLVGALVLPLADFFQRNGAGLAALILCFIGLFRLTDITMGVMANPFYLDMGYTLQEIGAVVKGFGLLASFAGIIVGGISLARLGVQRSLLIGGVLVIASNLSFALLALADGPDLLLLAGVISADNLAYNFAGTAFIAYMSGLTNAAYTATQYALFSSLFTLPGKVLAGGSGFVVEAVGYPWFFAYTSALGIPALLVLALLNRRLAARSQART
ncbi:MAG TPA: MFS transporter [Verrucomicrobiae bacterium]|nr:MFS transporter [Verrucomicrobiae bacterium]